MGIQCQHASRVLTQWPRTPAMIGKSAISRTIAERRIAVGLKACWARDELGSDLSFPRTLLSARECGTMHLCKAAIVQVTGCQA